MFLPGDFCLTHMLIILLTSVLFAGQPTRRAVDFDRGGMLYEQNCWMCHGKMGEGGGPAASAFPTQSPAIARAWSGTERSDAVRVILSGKGDMPGFAQVFDKNDAKRILTWLEEPGPYKKPSKDGDKKKKSAEDKRKKAKKKPSKPVKK